MSYDDLRIGRYSSAGQLYLVTTVTLGRCRLFADFDLARCVVAEMRRTHDGGHLNSLAWVVMPDHLHWLFQLGDTQTLAQVMQGFKGRSARAVNVRQGVQSSVWQRGYFDRALRAEEDVHAVARYLAGNPLRAGLVAQLGDYAHWDAVWV